MGYASKAAQPSPPSVASRQPEALVLYPAVIRLHIMKLARYFILSGVAVPWVIFRHNPQPRRVVPNVVITRLCLSVRIILEFITACNFTVSLFLFP